MKKAVLLFLVITCTTSYAGDNKFISTSGEVKLSKKGKSSERSVIIYLSEAEIPSEAKRIGIIYNTERDQETAFNQVKALASRAGGNAVFFVGGKDISAGQKMFNNFIWPGTYKARWNFLVYYDPTIKTDSSK